MPALPNNGSQVKCAYPHDTNRDSHAGQFSTSDTGDGSTIKFDEGASGERSPGVSRGTTGLAFHTYLSRRVKYIEPYGGFDVLFEFPNQSSDYNNC